MSLIEWNDSFSLGIDKIDEQHQRLIALLNKLHDAMKTGQGKEVLTDILNGLIEYTAYHFKTEEDLFQKFSFEGKDGHVAEHKAFVDRLNEFQTKFGAGDAVLTMEILQFLNTWVRKHIQGIDREYIDCFKENGVK